MGSRSGREQERVATILFYGIVLFLGYLFVRIVAPFFTALGWAAVLAVFVYPWHEKLARRYGDTRAAALSTFVVTQLILGPGLVILTAFVQESRAAVATGRSRRRCRTICVSRADVEQDSPPNPRPPGH